jgi:SAM-dependent methyltransferase
MNYVHSLPTDPTIKDKGLSGYEFGPLNQDNLQVYYLDVVKGHDTYQISRKITRVYFVLSGDGYFAINGKQYAVAAGALVEVPPKVEYSYSGTMKLVCFATPRWFPGNDITKGWNPDVIRTILSASREDRSFLSRVAALRLFRKSPLSAYLRINRRIWNHLPSFIADSEPMRLYGRFLHKLARLQGNRTQALATFFFRNRPELELMGRLAGQNRGKELRIAVLGCSTGAEAYSVAWSIRSANPDLALIMQGVDISSDAVEIAKKSIYPLQSSELTGTNMFERMTEIEFAKWFERDGEAAKVKNPAREGITWHIGDVGCSGVLEWLGSQDMVVANNFLCHMNPSEAERCLRNIAGLVKPGGFMFVSGIDLDVRTKVALELEWTPLQELLKEIHEGDPCLLRHWPCDYSGLEPFNNKRADWQLRYAAAFQVRK